MLRFIGRVLGITAFLIVSCILTYPNNTFAIPPLSDSDAKRIVEEGTNKEFFLYAPTGDIRIAVIADEARPKNKLFSEKTMESFRNLEKIGLLSITEKNGKCEIGRICYIIKITEKGEKFKDRTDELGFYWFKTAYTKVNKIVRNTEYKNIEAPNDEFRLVLGVYDYYHTEIGKEFYEVYGKNTYRLHKQYKFKALLKHEPFQNKYIYIKRDWGYLDKDTFETKRIL